MKNWIKKIQKRRAIRLNEKRARGLEDEKQFVKHATAFFGIAFVVCEMIGKELNNN